jgi:DNA-directed RNA polymerase subunit omega
LKPQKADRYTAIMVVSQRARQLIDGAAPVLETKACKPVTVAIEELEAGKISWEYKSVQ